MAYDSGNGEVYVADSGSNNVSVISGTTVVATVGVQGEPTAGAYDSGNGDVYVGNYENSVSVISGTNLLATIFDNYGAFDAAYDSGNGEVYVANYGSNSMYVISTMLDLGGLAGRTALDVGQAASLSAAVMGPGAGITRVSAQVSPSRFLLLPKRLQQCSRLDLLSSLLSGVVHCHPLRGRRAW